MGFDRSFPAEEGIDRISDEHLFPIFFTFTFLIFTIALYGILINICRKTHLILIQIPLMSYFLLQSHFRHSQSHSMT